MAPRNIEIRARFFVAVEGESEQSFIRWLQDLADKKLHIHLDAVVLGGGGYKSMLQKAARLHKRGRRARPYKDRFLVVDRDRAAQGDWSISELKRKAALQKFIVLVQNPNHEGLLFRMRPGNEREIPDAAAAMAKLKSHWPSYQKPANAHELGRRFTLEDLLRVARVDGELGMLLKRIGMLGRR